MCNCFFYDVCFLRFWVELLNECEQRLITVKGSFFFHTIIITGVKVIEVPTGVLDIQATLQVKNLCLCFWRELNTGEVSNYIVVKSFCHTICFGVLDYNNMVAFGQKFKNRPNFYGFLIIYMACRPCTNFLAFFAPSVNPASFAAGDGAV